MPQFSRRLLLRNLTAVFTAVSIPNFVKSKTSTTHFVSIKRMKFDPEILNVKVGDKIIWKNFDIAPHTATALDKSWDTGNLKKEDEYSLTVHDSISEDYYCKYHPNMKGKIVL